MCITILNGKNQFFFILKIYIFSLGKCGAVTTSELLEKVKNAQENYSFNFDSYYHEISYDLFNDCKRKVNDILM